MNLHKDGIILRYPRFFAEWAYPAFEKHHTAFLRRGEPVEVHSKAVERPAGLKLESARGGFVNFAKNIDAELMLKNNASVALAFHPCCVNNEFAAFDWFFTAAVRIFLPTGSVFGPRRKQFHRIHQLENRNKARRAILGRCL